MFKLNRADFGLVDIQFCHGNNEDMFAKELSFMSGNSIIPNYFLFKPPFDIRELTRKGRKKNLFCQKYINGLTWNEGDVDYCNVSDTISPLNRYKYIFVFGKAKKDFLSKYLESTIINLENLASLRNFFNYTTGCPTHTDLRYKCAVNNVYKIFVFIEKNYLQIEHIAFEQNSNKNKIKT